MPVAKPDLPPEDEQPLKKPGNRDPRKKISDEEQQRSPTSGAWLLLLVIIIALGMLLFWQSPANRGSPITYSFLIEQVNKENVKSVTFYDNRLTGVWKEIPANPDPKGKAFGDAFNVVLPEGSQESLVKLLEEKKVVVDAQSTGVSQGTYLMFLIFGPLLLVAFFWFMMRRSADPMGTGVLGNFIRSPAKRFRPTGQTVTFADVAAMENAKAELREVVDFLKDPARFQKLGAQIPKGVLLVGPPGTGKTLLARATAGEAGVPFFSISGSEFIQMFVGVGASRVRDLFRTAKENSPCIIFVDEIDAVGRVRGAGVGGGHDEREQTLNQILSEMDGFEQTEAVIVVAATNRPDVLDPALLRPGRFDRHITIDRPNKEGRKAILKVHSRKVPLSDDVDLDKIAAGTIGFSGADLRNLVNEAALIATRQNKSAVDMDDFETARDRVLMGPVREETMNAHEREMTAYHEAGHALLAWMLPDADVVHKVTIIPRGRALGVTQLLPDEERYNIGEQRLHSQLVFIMGGRAAEKLVFDEYSAGAENDLKQATRIARRMVAHWGMSELIGPVAFPQGEEHPFLGKEIHEHREYSEKTAHVIDQEVQRFLTDASERATRMLVEHRDELDRIAQALLEKETLSKDEMAELLSTSVQAGSDGKN